MENIKYGIQCKECNDRIFSFYRHDFKCCQCKSTYIDGGDDYFKVSGDPNNVETIIFCEEIDIIRKK